MNKNDIMVKLQNGVSAVDLANEFTDMLNEAMAEVESQKAENEKMVTKRELAKRFSNIVRDYAMIECPDLADEFDNLDAEDQDELIAMLDEVFAALRAAVELKKILGDALGDISKPKTQPTPKTNATDDEIFASFLAKNGFANLS